MEDEFSIRYVEIRNPGYRKIFSREREKASLDEKAIVLAEMVISGDFHRSMPYVTTMKRHYGYCMALNLRRMEENNKTSIKDAKEMIRKELALIRSGRYDRRRDGLLAKLYEVLIEDAMAKRYARRED